MTLDEALARLAALEREVARLKVPQLARGLV